MIGLSRTISSYSTFTRSLPNAVDHPQLCGPESLLRIKIICPCQICNTVRIPRANTFVPGIRGGITRPCTRTELLKLLHKCGTSSPWLSRKTTPLSHKHLCVPYAAMLKLRQYPGCWSLRAQLRCIPGGKSQVQLPRLRGLLRLWQHRLARSNRTQLQQLVCMCLAGKFQPAVAEGRITLLGASPHARYTAMRPYQSLACQLRVTATGTRSLPAPGPPCDKPNVGWSVFLPALEQTAKAPLLGCPARMAFVLAPWRGQCSWACVMGGAAYMSCVQLSRTGTPAKKKQADRSMPWWLAMAVITGIGT